MRQLFTLLFLLSFLVTGRIEAGLSDKPICVIYGNCQMRALYKYLVHAVESRDSYTYTYIPLKNFTGDSSAIGDTVATADLFIYQPVTGHTAFDTDVLLDRIKGGCQTLSVPPLYCSLYFPDFVGSNSNTLMSQQVINLYNDNATIDEISAAITSVDFYTSDYLVTHSLQVFRCMQNREAATDVSVLGFINENFMTTRLFHTMAHPTNALLKEVARQVFVSMNLDYSNIDTDGFWNVEFLSGSLPIYPSVVNFLELSFDPEQPQYNGVKGTDMEYITGYITSHPLPLPLPL